MKQYDVVALGECLIDFLCTRSENSLIMEGNAGGAPANVLAMLAKLGHRTALISKVGQDSFGSFLCDQVSRAGVHAGAILRDQIRPTTLAIVQLDETGNRSFSFYRDRTADVMLRQDELPLDLLRNTQIFQFGSLSLTAEPARTATFEAIRIARESGATISYDPNLRPLLWDDQAVARAMLTEGLSKADLVKMSEEELTFITGETDLSAAALGLCRMYPIKLMAVTLGPRGCLYCVGGHLYSSPAFAVDTIDTTGAGDASWGAALSWLLASRCAPGNLPAGAIADLMTFANAAGSLATTRKGAISALPERQAIEHCIRTTACLPN